MDWNNLYKIENPNQLWEYFIEEIVSCLEVMCPLKKFNINEYKESWMNRDLMEMIIDKDLALKKAKKNGKC